MSHGHPVLGLSPSDCDTLGLRIVVIGGVGAGKSHFSRRLAEKLGIHHIERDRLNQPLDSERHFREVAAEVGSEQWVFDGFPYHTEQLVFPRATMVVALDYEKSIVLQRVLRRTVRGMFATWPWRATWEWKVFARTHPIRWSASTWAERRGQIRVLRNHPIVSHTQFVCCPTPAEAEALLVRSGPVSGIWADWTIPQSDQKHITVLMCERTKV